MTFIKTFFHKIGYGFGFGIGMTSAYCFVNRINSNDGNSQKKFNTSREYPQI